MAVKNKAETRQPTGAKPERSIPRARDGRRRASASYLALARAYPLRPIRSAEDLDEAIAVLDGLLCRRKPLDEQEQDYLDCLGQVIERYESEAQSMPAVSGPDMLRHLIDARGATLSEVAQGTGITLSTLSAILNKKGRRKLNLAHIEALAPYFGVEPGVFL